LPYDPDEEAARLVRHARDGLLKPFRLDLEAFLHARIGTHGIPLADHDWIFRLRLAESLLALCLYAKSHDLDSEQQFIVGYNVAVLRKSLRYPEVRKEAELFQKKSLRRVQQEPYDNLKKFIQTDGLKQREKNRRLRRIDIARAYRKSIDPKKYGLAEMPTVRTINQDWLKEVWPA
jgi:hypothetical protein